MTATLSTLGLTSPFALRMGVWHPVTQATAAQPQILAKGSDPCMAEWVMPKTSMAAWPALALMALALGVISCLLWQAQPEWPQAHAWACGLAALACSTFLGALHVRRHRDDADHIAMHVHSVRVAQHRAGRVSRTHFHPRWLRVEPEWQDGSMLRLHGQGRSALIGEFLEKQGRQQLAAELRSVLKHLDD